MKGFCDGFCFFVLADDCGCDIVLERPHGFEPASDSQVHRGQAQQSAPSQLPETSLRSVEETRQIGEALQGQKLLQTFFRHGQRDPEEYRNRAQTEG